MKNFKNKVLETVAEIPKGKTLSYKGVAIRAGNPKAARAVGSILNRNYNDYIPCHRVIRSDGSLGGFNRGIKMKEKILNREIHQ